MGIPEMWLGREQTFKRRMYTRRHEAVLTLGSLVYGVR